MSPTVKPLAERDVPAFDPALNWLDGGARRGDGGTIDVTFPVTGEVLGGFAAASDEQVAAAVAGARESFDAGVWSRRPASERAALLEGMAEHLVERREELTLRVIFDNGKTRPEAEVDVLAAAGACRAAAEAVRNDREQELPAERGVVKKVWRAPVGVVAALTPFNAPLMFAGLKVTPALAAGNSVILKPSERAPWLPVAICEAAAAAGLPPGVLQLIQGRGPTAAALCADERIDMISLTGGVATGTAVMRAAAPGIKNLLLELGGKSAHVVLADADLEPAVEAVAAGIFKNSGQRCLSGSRLIVEEAVADEVEERVIAIARDLRVGDPFAAGTEVGAMIDEVAVAAAESFVAHALADGLSVAVGGERIAELAPGCFFRPTVLLGADADSWAAQTELFGPVLTVIRVPDAEAALTAANASRYGLAGGLWTRDMDRALDFARRVRTGYFWINTYGAMFGDLPFGGFGLSGMGREGGSHAYEAYTELKAVMLDATGGTSAPRLGRTGPEGDA